MSTQPARTIALKWFMFLVAATLVITCLFLGALDAMEREFQMQEQVRLDRCTRFGESLPKEWQDYCNEGGDHGRPEAN